MNELFIIAGVVVVVVVLIALTNLVIETLAYRAHARFLEGQIEKLDIILKKYKRV